MMNSQKIRTRILLTVLFQAPIKLRSIERLFNGKERTRVRLLVEYLRFAGKLRRTGQGTKGSPFILSMAPRGR